MAESIFPFPIDASAPPAPPTGPVDAPLDTALSDREFTRTLARLRRMASYLMELDTDFEAKVLEAARLGALNLLKDVSPMKGRLATGKEWQDMQVRTQLIWSALTGPQRRKFLASEIPGWFSYLVLVLMFIAIGSISTAFVLKVGAEPVGATGVAMAGKLFFPFVFWIGSLGAIGAVASIGMNALSVQDDVTFDISSSKFLWLRVVLGALFGTVLTLPLGFVGFQQFLAVLASGDAKPVDANEAVKQASMLLMPFILGFSTSLVILVLNRMVEAVQTFFGKTAAPKGDAGAVVPRSAR
jgi:hypothetical protein